MNKTYEERTGSLGVDSFGPSHGSRSVCPSVVCTLESDQVGPSSSLPCKFHGSFDGLGSRVPEKE